MPLNLQMTFCLRLPTMLSKSTRCAVSVSIRKWSFPTIVPYNIWPIERQIRGFESVPYGACHSKRVHTPEGSPINVLPALPFVTLLDSMIHCLSVYFLKPLATSCNVSQKKYNRNIVKCIY